MFAKQQQSTTDTVKGNSNFSRDDGCSSSSIRTHNEDDDDKAEMSEQGQDPTDSHCTGEPDGLGLDDSFQKDDSAMRRRRRRPRHLASRKVQMKARMH